MLVIIIILSTSIVAVSPQRKYKHSETAINYVHSVETNIDTFFDRVVGIILDIPSVLHYDREIHERTFTTIALGVMITDQLILSSYNPYREIERIQNTLPKTTITVMVRRFVDRNQSRDSYQFGVGSEMVEYDVQCGRKVISEESDVVRDDMMHGKNRPQHDLIVIRVAPKIAFGDPVPPRLRNFDGLLTNANFDRFTDNWAIKVVLIRTKLAGPRDFMDRFIFWASLGHRNDEHINSSKFMQPVYDTVDSLVDCEEWFPRLWGRFICINNHQNFVGLASSAMLFSGDKLFGIGSFALFKLKKGILVFTDVRYYVELIFQTCTIADQVTAGN